MPESRKITGRLSILIKEFVKGSLCGPCRILGLLFPRGFIPKGAELGVKAEPITEIGPFLIRRVFSLGFRTASFLGEKMTAVHAGTDILPAVRASQGTSQGLGIRNRRTAVPTHAQIILQRLSLLNRVVQKLKFLNNFLIKPAVLQVVDRKTARLVQQPTGLLNKSNIPRCVPLGADGGCLSGVCPQ
jgi:hypothetical protein